MTTPSLRDAQVAKLIAENERLREALKACLPCFAGDPTFWYEERLIRLALAEAPSPILPQPTTSE